MTTPARLFRRLALCTVVAASSCGPERAPIMDVERIKKAYCEKTVACANDPDVDFDFCMQRLDAYGIAKGEAYDEYGCLDEEAEFLECLTEMTCEDLFWTRYSVEGGPCYDKMQAVYDAGCPPETG